MIKELKKREVIIGYHDRAMRKIEKDKELDSMVPVEKDHLEDICELAIMECTRCRKGIKEIQDCKQRKLFLKYDIEPLKHEVEEGECPYQYKEG